MDGVRRAYLILNFYILEGPKAVRLSRLQVFRLIRSTIWVASVVRCCLTHFQSSVSSYKDTEARYWSSIDWRGYASHYYPL